MHFHQAYPLFKDGIVSPMKDFATEVFEQMYPQIPLTSTSSVAKAGQTSSAEPAAASNTVTRSPPSSPPTISAPVISNPFVEVAIPPTSVAPSSLSHKSTTPTAPLAPTAFASCSFPAAAAQSGISDDLINPSLFSTGPGPVLVDIRTLIFDGSSSSNLVEGPDETSAKAKVDKLPVAKKRKATVTGKSQERENDSSGLAADPGSRPCKRTKATAKAKTDVNLGVVAGTRPSRANAGGKYKAVRDQVKVGRKEKAKPIAK